MPFQSPPPESPRADSETPPPEQRKISASTFRRAYERFQRIHTDHCGRRLESFTDRTSMAYEWEGYKNAIPDRAEAAMEPRTWSRRLIGTGEILRKVIAGIELTGNNLLQWEPRNGPNSRVHLPLIKAGSDSAKCRELEELFFALYAQERAEHDVFDTLVALCGRRYELLSYLFFIANPSDFLPVRTRSFDRVFVELGVNLQTRGQCGWENYQEFLRILRNVRSRLHSEGISDAMLIDAHSFCWILARIGDGEHGARQEVPFRFEAFAGSFHQAFENPAFSPNDDAEVRDMQQESQRRRATGEIAEEQALQTERGRLVAAGRPDLARRVDPCGNRPGLGFDIKSFEADGTERCIEVKNVSNGRRFFLSEWEWQNSRHRTNYWFYLVDVQRRVVTPIPAARLSREHLCPVDYLVAYSETPETASS